MKISTAVCACCKGMGSVPGPIVLEVGDVVRLRKTDISYHYWHGVGRVEEIYAASIIVRFLNGPMAGKSGGFLPSSLEFLGDE